MRKLWIQTLEMSHDIFVIFSSPGKSDSQTVLLEKRPEWLTFFDMALDEVAEWLLFFDKVVCCVM